MYIQCTTGSPSAAIRLALTVKEAEVESCPFSDQLSDWENSSPCGEERAVAVQRILDCYSRNGADLDLSGLHLTSLPAMLPSSVQKINLSDNNIASFHHQILPLISKEIKVEYEKNPCCTLGNRSYRFEKIASDTPILFQWSFLNEKIKRDEGENNSAFYTYIGNIINACQMEQGRQIGVFISGRAPDDIINKLEELSSEIHNLNVIYADNIDFGRYGQNKCTQQIEKSLDDLIAEVEQDQDPEDDVLFCKAMANKTIKKLEKSEPNLTLFDVCTRHDNFITIDFYRVMFMLEGNAIFSASNKNADGRQFKSAPTIDASSHGALIYLDVDMKLNGPLGDIWLPDGIGVYHAPEKSPTLENGIIAVSQPQHPALLDIIPSVRVDFLGKIAADEVYGCFVRTLHNHYKPSENESLSEFIAFPIGNITPDESRTNIVSYIHTS